jgi:hypothetical protein
MAGMHSRPKFVLFNAHSRVAKGAPNAAKTTTFKPRHHFVTFLIYFHELSETYYQKIAALVALVMIASLSVGS